MSKAQLLADRLSFEDHIDDDLVLMRDGGVMAMFEVSGVYPDTADDGQIIGWFDQLHNSWKNIQADDVELTILRCREEADTEPYQAALHEDEFAIDLHAAYVKNLFAITLYNNPIYLAIIVHPPGAVAKSLAQAFSDAGVSTSGSVEEIKGRLNEICTLLQSRLAPFGLRRLGYVPRNHIVFDEIAEAIVFATTGVRRQIGATTGRMGNAMFSETLHFHRRHIEIDGAGDPSCAAIFAFREYPASTAVGMFRDLEMTTYRCTLAQSYRFMSNAAGGGVIGRKQNKMLVARDKAHSQEAELSHAADQLLSRKWVLGDHSLVFIVFAEHRKALVAVANAAWRDMAACGLVASRVKRNLQAAWLSMLPGGAFWRPMPGFIKSSNFVAFEPLCNWPKGQEKAHWPGPPVATFRSPAGTPYSFHWHVNDVANTLVTGETGSGKTTLISFLIAMTAGRARIVALDHKRGWSFLTREMGGDYAVLGEGQPHCAPLKALDNTQRNVEFLIDLYRGCIGGRMTQEEDRRLALGISIIMELPPQDRSVSELRAFFDAEAEGAGTRLEPWCYPDGELGWVVDAPRDTVSFARFSAFDTTALLENARARGPSLAYIFHRISLLLDGSPILIPCDEGWRILIDPVFRGMIERQLRTIRSRNGAVVFITQSPRDIIDSGIANILSEQCPTQFHLANPRGTRSDYIDGLKLTEGQYEAFRGIQAGQGMFLLIQGSNSFVGQLPLHGLDDEIRILSPREADLRQADNVLEFRQAAE